MIRKGACADLPRVDGNPLEHLSTVNDPENLRIIMKNGNICKNTL